MLFVLRSLLSCERSLILDVRIISLEADLRVPGNRDEFPLPLPSCVYRASFPLLVVAFHARVQFWAKNLSSQRWLRGALLGASRTLSR